MNQKRRADQAGYKVEDVGRKLGKDKEKKRPKLMWLNHFDLLPGDGSVATSHDAVSSGVGGGLTGLVITSTTTGENGSCGGYKVVQMAVEVPPDYLVTGVRVGYELTDAKSHISQIRLAQVQDPPEVALVLLDDGTDHTDVGPIHVDSSPTSIEPAKDALLLSLFVNFGDVSDKIVIRSLALHLAGD